MAPTRTGLMAELGKDTLNAVAEINRIFSGQADEACAFAREEDPGANLLFAALVWILAVDWAWLAYYWLTRYVV